MCRFSLCGADTDLYRSNRGFAFVEFGSHGTRCFLLPVLLHFLTLQLSGDAEKAMSGLKHTHLYGRHLVIEWSEDDSSGGLGSLRQRAAKRYAELSAGISTENKKARTS